ncbi:MAG: response regulator [Deltaproteobacteria bacterium]|nr:response regulator [Deltaproteobacteria bacterium]
MPKIMKLPTARMHKMQRRMSYLNAVHLNSAHKEKFHCGTGVRFVANTEASIVGKRFLVLDDEFLIALDIQQILESAGAASVTCFGDAAAALAALRAGAKFDLAVLDVKLNGTADTSIDVAAALTAQETPFIFLTGMQEDRQMKQFPNAPVVEKPYPAHLLIAAVVRALGLR